MEYPDNKFLLKISERGEIRVHAWISEEQKKFIEQYFANTKPAVRYNITIESIITTVCEYVGVDMTLLTARTRKAEIALARQLCFYFFVKYLNYSTARAGRIFNRDHATVLHAIRKMNEPKYQLKLNAILNLLEKEFHFPVATPDAQPLEAGLEPHILKSSFQNV